MKQKRHALLVYHKRKSCLHKAFETLILTITATKKVEFCAFVYLKNDLKQNRSLRFSFTCVRTPEQQDCFYADASLIACKELIHVKKLKKTLYIQQNLNQRLWQQRKLCTRQGILLAEDKATHKYHQAMSEHQD